MLKIFLIVVGLSLLWNVVLYFRIKKIRVIRAKLEKEKELLEFQAKVIARDRV